jgi:predicted RNA-binding protein
MNAINERIKNTKLAEIENTKIRRENELIDNKYEESKKMLDLLDKTLPEEGPELHKKYSDQLVSK